MHFCKVFNYFTIWLVIFGIIETEVALCSMVNEGLFMLHGKTMKSIVFLDPVIIIFI